MKRIIFSLLLILVLLSCLGVAALASDSPLIVDEAGVLDITELQELTDYAKTVSDRHTCDVGVVFISSLNGRDVTAYADDYFDYNGYGYGANSNGILLLVSVGDREFATTTCGKAIYAFSDRTLAVLEDDYFVPELSDSDWADAAEEFIEGCDRCLTAYENSGVEPGGTAPVKTAPDGSTIAAGCAIVVAVSFLLAGIPTGIMKRKLKTVEKQSGAADYTRPGSFALHRNTDRFLYSHVTRTPRPKNNSSSGGRSSVHISSSGRSHGGSRGRF